MVTRMREKGQVTIPSSIRESLHWSKDDALYITRVAGGVLIMPKPSAVDAFGAKFSKAADEKGISLEDLLRDLKKIRRRS